MSRFTSQEERSKFIRGQLGSVSEKGWLWDSDVKVLDITREMQKYKAQTRAGLSPDMPDISISDYKEYSSKGFWDSVAKGRTAPEGAASRIVYDWYQKNVGDGKDNPELTPEQKRAMGGIAIGIDDQGLAKEATARLVAGYYRDHPGDKRPYTPGPETVRKEIIRHAFAGDATPRKPDSNPAPRPVPKPAQEKIPSNLPPRKYKPGDFSFN